jgi:NADH-quinone oxidoreductase subunit L
MVLAVGALVLGFSFHNELLGDSWHAFWGNSIEVAPDNHVLHDMEELPGWVGFAPLVLGLLGIATAYVFYMFQPWMPARLAATFPGVYRFLLNKWYFDELYNFLFVRTTFTLARLFWQVGDVRIIDGIADGIGSLAEDGSAQVVRVQNGSIAVYAFAMLIGLVLLVSIFLLFLR